MSTPGEANSGETATVRLNVYPRGRAELVEAASQRIATRLAHRITQDGRASLAVSGGSTPRAVYQALSEADLDWSKVDVVLVDERWVEPGEEGSNETFVHDTLLTGKARAAQFIGLKRPGAFPGVGGQPGAFASLDGIAQPVSVCVLGMGSDGHTASWFPHAEGLDAALDPAAARVVGVRAHPSEVTGAFLERATLNLGAIAPARTLILLLTGQDKLAAFKAASDPGPIEAMPIRALLRRGDLTLTVYYAD